MKNPYTVVLIVPTGIGASIGGYAGDALPVARAIAHVSDHLITHPNVLNGAQLYWSLPNALYTEGYALDKFAQGDWGLQPVRQNRIGVIFDQGIEDDLRLRHLQVIDACRATLGLHINDYIITDQPLDVELRTADSGASWGTIGQPASLLRAAEVLIKQGKVGAIAVVARFPDDPDNPALTEYRHGGGVDALAGAEAVISHLIVRQFQIPCAHAPALSPLPLDPALSPKSAAEEIGYTFLPCVLVGLSRAPQFITNKNNIDCHTDQTIWADQVNTLIIPASACGGSAVLSFAQTQTKIITVAENTTTLQVFPHLLGIDHIQVNSYLEAIGWIVADQAGIYPPAMRSLLSPVRQIKTD